MSSDNYVRHLVQKYRLAVAVAVIHTKPETKSLDRHIVDLRNKYDNDNKDDDDDEMICSDDFENINENDFQDVIVDDLNTSETVLKEYNVEVGCLQMRNERVDNFDVSLAQNVYEERQDQANNYPIDTQSTFCETQPYIAIESLTDTDKTFCNSIARIHEENIMDIDKTCVSIARINDTQITIDRTMNENVNQINKKIDYNIRTNANENSIKQADLSKSGDNIHGILELETAFDSQATELYTLNNDTQIFTHLSQSQNLNVDVSNKYIKGVTKSIGNQSANEFTNDLLNDNTDFNCQVKDVEFVNKIIENLDKEKDINLDKEKDMQAEMYSCVESPQNNDNFDNSNGGQFQQTEFLDVSKKYDSDTLPYFKDANLVQKISNNLAKDNIVMQTIHQDDTRDHYSQKTHICKESYNIQDFSQEFNIENAQGSNNFDNTNEITTKIDKTSATNTDNVTMEVHKNNSQNVDENINADDDFDSDGDGSQIELIPFKVMEELNRIKLYLNRNLERRMSYDSSLDSGYRSDSQGRSSQGRSGFQLSGNWVGQSGHCLYEHLIRCPLVATTEEIVGEISEVLGQLIDKLHEEEFYPAFLEELLDQVDALIQGVLSDDEMVLDKEEKIQRLFLLNISIHIQKHSIEKITYTLEQIYTHLTQTEESYELTNINELANSSYIFHILEVILRKYLKCKKIVDSQTQSQDTVISQKRSTISDIWRKKWNPNYKEDCKNEGSYEKKCVLKECNEVLNKIIVGCMDGYSLVAFGALQCFNLLQS